MGDTDLLDWARDHAHRGDPGTSFAAAAAAEQFATSHCARILRALKQFPAGLTFHEIAALTKLDYHAVARRVSDLVKVNSAENSGNLRRNPSGRQAAVWRARDG